MLTVAALLAALSCQNSPSIVDRLNAPYFPLKTGNTWIYQTSDSSLVNAKVVADSTIEGDSLRFYEFLGEVQRFLPRREVVLRWTVTRVYHLGTPIVLEERWQKYLELPPVAGNTWHDAYEHQLVLQNDTLRVSHTLRGAVGSPQRLQVPAGTYEAYPVDLHETRIVQGFQPRVDSSWVHLDLAAGVGPVRMIRWLWNDGGFQADTFVLVTFVEGP